MSLWYTIELEVRKVVGKSEEHLAFWTSPHGLVALCPRIMELAREPVVRPIRCGDDDDESMRSAPIALMAIFLRFSIIVWAVI